VQSYKSGNSEQYFRQNRGKSVQIVSKNDQKAGQHPLRRRPAVIMKEH